MSDVRYSYLHGPNRHVTIARSADLEKKLVYCGVSVCHPSDVFRKAQGRIMAEGRLEASRNDPITRLAWVLSLPSEAKPLETIMGFLACGGNFNPEVDPEETIVPTCVKELAKKWRKQRS